MSDRRSAGGIQTRSHAMRRALELCRLYARVNRPILFLGPVGAGKTTLAEEIYRAARLRGKFVQVSVGSIPDGLYTDFLFGHVAGAFTNASCARSGALVAAAHGMLFLDDIAQMPLVAQAALLGVMDQSVFRATGATGEQSVTCRFLFASTDELTMLVSEGRMLRDFAGRVGAFIIRVPGLADRKEDIGQLAQHTAEAFLTEHGLEPRVRFDDAVTHVLLAYDWPGNVRELKAVIERATAHAFVEDGATVIRLAHLPEELTQPSPAQGSTRMRLAADLVRRTVHEVGGNRSEAARRLGVHRNTIGRHLPREG